MALTRTQVVVIRRALHRPGHYVCPTPGLWAASQTAVLHSLRQLGLITQGLAPVLTEEGVAAAAAYDAEHDELSTK